MNLISKISKKHNFGNHLWCHRFMKKWTSFLNFLENYSLSWRKTYHFVILIFIPISYQKIIFHDRIPLIDHFCCFLSYFENLKFYTFHDILQCSNINLMFHTLKFKLHFPLFRKYNFVVHQFKQHPHEHPNRFIYFLLGHPIIDQFFSPLFIFGRYILFKN